MSFLKNAHIKHIIQAYGPCIREMHDIILQYSNLFSKKAVERNTGVPAGLLFKTVHLVPSTLHKH